MPYKTPNPVQKIQGFVETGSASVTTTGMQTARVPTTFPGARIEFFHAGTDAHARFYDENGNDLAVDFILADANGFYSFFSETGRYSLKFFDPAQPQTEVAPPKDLKVESRTFNVHDYGAKGDGTSDDTVAIRAALAAMVAANAGAEGVGTLFFPSGRYKVSRQADLVNFILDLPSGTVIQGTAGPYSGIGTSNCQIVLTSEACSIFHIRNNRHKITIRDIGLTTAVGDITNTIAIDARQDVAEGFTNEIEFDNLTIWKFGRGISMEGSHIPDPLHPGTFFQWDITGVRVNHCTIVECQYGIYVDSQNASFLRIVDSRIGADLDGFGMYMEKVGIITFDSILGAGQVDTTADRRSDTFIYLTAGRGTVTIINCECEGFERSLRVVGPGAVGNVAWPIVLLNCALGPTVQIESQCDVVSVGTRYLPETVQFTGGVDKAMIFSFGDVIIDLDKIENPAYDFHLNSTSRVAARANRYRVDFQRPTRIGGQAGQPPAILDTVALAVSTFDSGQAQVALCNPAGLPLYKVRAEVTTTPADDAIYFENPRTSERLMKLKSNGDLLVKGQVLPNSTF